MSSIKQQRRKSNLERKNVEYKKNKLREKE